MLVCYLMVDESQHLFLIAPLSCNRTVSNRSGGIQGGISNGENIILRVAFKPTSTIGQEQRTVSRSGEETTIRGKGRHDPCVLPRAVPMVESMVALVLIDALMCHQAQCNFFPRTIDFSSDSLDQKSEKSNTLGKKLHGFGIKD